MKKIYLLFLSFICLCSMSVFAESPCDSEIQVKKPTPCEKPCQKPCQKPCTNPCEKPAAANPCASDCFLCTNKNMNSLFNEMNLSETQMCTAMKIQEKYEQETLSLNERIQCEKQALCKLEQTCAKGSEIRKQKRLIKKLEKKKKEICKCYEEQFKAIISNDQKKIYNKCKK